MLCVFLAKYKWELFCFENSIDFLNSFVKWSFGIGNWNLVSRDPGIEHLAPLDVDIDANAYRPLHLSLPML